MLKIGEIRELIRLLDETGLTEIRLEQEDMKLHLRKAPAQVAQVQVAPQVAPVHAVAAQVAPMTLPQNEAAASTPVVEAAPEANVHFIKSPMVGTFYRAPSPDAASFADVGTRVGEKSVVCIVEAMKLMNEIEAEVSGEVVEVLASNGQLVEYGQPLFKIKLS